MISHWPFSVPEQNNPLCIAARLLGAAQNFTARSLCIGARLQSCPSASFGSLGFSPCSRRTAPHARPTRTVCLQTISFALRRNHCGRAHSAQSKSIQEPTMILRGRVVATILLCASLARPSRKATASISSSNRLRNEARLRGATPSWMVTPSTCRGTSELIPRR